MRSINFARFSLAALLCLSTFISANAQFGGIKNIIKDKTPKPQTTPTPTKTPSSGATSNSTFPDSETPKSANKTTIAWQKSADMLKADDNEELSTAINAFAVGADGSIYGGAKRFYVSTDNGKTWTMNSKGFISDPWREIISLAVSPKGTIFAGMREYGIWMSADKGKTWKQANATGYPKVPQFRDVVGIVIDASGKVYAGTDGEGVFVSADNGKTWKASNAGLPKQFDRRVVRSLAINQQGHVFASVDGSSVFRSTDGGATWEHAGFNADNSDKSPLAPYELIFNKQGHLFAATFIGVFRSTDAGANWKRLGNGRIDRLAVGADGSIYGIIARTSSTLWFSRDNGDSWTQANTPSENTYSIINLPNGELLAGTTDTEGLFVYRATVK